MPFRDRAESTGLTARADRSFPAWRTPVAAITHLPGRPSSTRRIRPYNCPLPVAEPELSIVVARLERLSEPAAFLDRLRRDVEALGVPNEIIIVSQDPRGFGHTLRAGFAQANGASAHGRPGLRRTDDVSGRPLAPAAQRRDCGGVSIRRGQPRRDAGDSRRRQPGPEPGVPPRSQPRRQRRIRVRIRLYRADVVRLARSRPTTTTCCRKCSCAPTPPAGACSRSRMHYGRVPTVAVQGACGAGARLPAHVLDAVEAAQLDRRRRLRLPRPRQPDSAAAILAAQPAIDTSPS